MSKTAIKATVRDIVPQSKDHGPYATASSRGLKGSVTFSLRATVWQEKVRPKRGDYVYLDDVRENDSGWRAHVARFWRPGDEQKTNQEQPGKPARRTHESRPAKADRRKD